MVMSSRYSVLYFRGLKLCRVIMVMPSHYGDAESL